MPSRNQKALSVPAMILFRRIAKRWDLPKKLQAQLLGREGHKFNAYLWRPAEGVEMHLPRKTLYRISTIIGIDNDVKQHFGGDDDEALTWLRSLNSAPLFGGYTPLRCIREADMGELRKIREFTRSMAAR